MTKIQNAARKLFDDWYNRVTYETLAGVLAPANVDEAYAIQYALQDLHQQHRGPIVGRKIALSSKAMQDMVGLSEPVGGAIFANDLHTSPATVKAADFIRMGLEFELAMELNADVTPASCPHDAQSVSQYIATVRPAFELIEDRAADYAHLDAFTLIADNAWCGGAVLGPSLENWTDLDLGDIPSVVRQTGQPDEPANTGACDPLGALAWVFNHFGARGITLKKGEHIITGSAVRTRFPKPGDEFSYEMAGTNVALSVV